MATSTVPHRASKPMTSMLHERTNTYLENLYIEGFDQLQSILTAGGSTSNKAVNLAPAFQPSRRQLILAATLIVHPRFSNHSRKSEDNRASDDAYQFLKTVLNTFGPVESGLAEAFVFGHEKPNRRKQRQTQVDDDLVGDNDEEEIQKLRNKYADEQSVFQQKEDVWQVVGWAFNTAAQHPVRWDRWKLFLDIVLDVFEQDILEWTSLHKQGTPNMKQSHALEALKSAANRTERRRIMRAILADGAKKSLQEFPEVFANETKEMKEKEFFNQRGKVKLEGGGLEDYADSDEDDIEMEDVSDSLFIDADENSTNVEVSRLRARFMTLLFSAANAPASGFDHPVDVLDTITEIMRPMPLDHFAQLVNDMKLTSKYYAAFLVNNIYAFLAAPPAHFDVIEPKQSDLEKLFISAVPNSHNAVDAAKMSILIEKLLVNLVTRNQLAWTTDLINAIDNGVSAREEGVLLGGTKEEQVGQEELRRGGRRILAFKEMFEAKSAFLAAPVVEARSSSPLSSLHTRQSWL